MRVSNEKCKKAAKTKGLSLLKTFGISGFFLCGECHDRAGRRGYILNGRWSNIEKALFKFFTQNGRVIRV